MEIFIWHHFYFLIQCIFLIATEESENKSPNKVTTAQATTNQGAECSYIDRLATNATTAVPGRKLQFHLDSSNDKKDDIKTDEEVIIRNRSLTWNLCLYSRKPSSKFHKNLNYFILECKFKHFLSQFQGNFKYGIVNLCN